MLFDNHPDFVEIGTLSGNLSAASVTVTLAAVPTETVDIADFLLINNEVIDVSFVNGAVISGARGTRGTDGTIHLGEHRYTF